MKRIFYLIGIIAAIGAVVAAGYYFRYQKKGSISPATEPQGGAAPLTLPPPPTTEQIETREVEITEKLEPIQGKELTKVAIIGGDVFDYFVYSATSSVIFQTDGQVVLLKQDGADVLSAGEIKNIIQAGFSSDGKKLMVIFGERGSPQASIFDLQTKSWQPLAETIYAFAWSPTGEQVAYLTKAGDKGKEIRILDTTKPGTKPQTILQLLVEDMGLVWPKSKEILIWETPSAKVPGSLLKMDLTKKTLVPIIQDQKGLDIIWSRVSNWGLVFESGLGEKGGTLRLAGGDGQWLRTLSFTTLPRKCAFYSDPENKEYLVCGVPLNLNQWTKAALPDAYLKKEIFSNDWLYRVDMKNGEIEIIYNSDTPIDAINLRVKDGFLYFQNRLDGKLYGLAL